MGNEAIGWIDELWWLLLLLLLLLPTSLFLFFCKKKTPFICSLRRHGDRGTLSALVRIALDSDGCARRVTDRQKAGKVICNE